MKCYVVDTFTDTLFSGNPAAVCILEKWLSDDLMQKIAMENNLSETAFTVLKEDVYELRWFTPGGEIDLCGHATLATAYVLMRFVELDCTRITFQTKSGQLHVCKKADLYEMDMPAYSLTPVAITAQMEEAIGVAPIEAWMGRDLVCVLENEQQVREARPDERKVKALDRSLLHLSARGKNYDCVTRSFAPKLNVYEDPVCGSGHCHVIPLWAEKLHISNVCALQASKRSGVLYCCLNGKRVSIAGKAILYAIVEIFL